MFRETDRQTSLLESQFLLPRAKRERLERSWAQVFRDRVLPSIDEEPFRSAFAEEGVGRPNKSIRLLVGLHLLKEMWDLTDDQVIEGLEFNLLWHHALAVDPGAAHVCQKTLHNFRQRLLGSERAKGVFRTVTQALVEADGLSVARQRLDSTHIMSNIARLNRLGLFVATTSRLIHDLQRRGGERLSRVDPRLRARYADDCFGDATREQVRGRLPVAAQDLARLVRRFASDPEVSGWESYILAARLLAEQCHVQATDEQSEGEETVEVQLKEPEEISGASVQSPHDPDASYGHKGKGYEAQIAETCDAENPYQVVTDVEINGANEPDAKALVPALERLLEGELMPEELLADAGYGSGENIVAAAERGVELVAPVRSPGGDRPTDAWTDAVREDVTDTLAELGAVTPLELADFTFNATFTEALRCPNDRTPREQSSRDGAYRAVFAARHCGACPLASACPTRVNKAGDRTLRWTPKHAATATRQRAQREPDFRRRYRRRSGIESTNAELKHRHGAGNLRVRRWGPVRLAILLKATALNVKRALSWHVRRLLEALTPAPSPTEARA
jgi:hypothetical protein